MKHAMVGPLAVLDSHLTWAPLNTSISRYRQWTIFIYEASLVLSFRDVGSFIYSMSNIQRDSFQRVSAFSSAIRSYAPNFL